MYKENKMSETYCDRCGQAEYHPFGTCPRDIDNGKILFDEDKYYNDTHLNLNLNYVHDKEKLSIVNNDNNKKVETF